MILGNQRVHILIDNKKLCEDPVVESVEEVTIVIDSGKQENCILCKANFNPKGAFYKLIYIVILIIEHDYNSFNKSKTRNERRLVRNHQIEFGLLT